MNQTNFFSKAKPIRFMVLLAGMLTAFTVAAQDINTGLIMHYTFDDVTDTLIPDASGNNNLAILEGNATIIEGYSGMGLNMMEKPDFVTLPSSFTSSLTSFSFAIWVNFAELKGATRFFDFGNGADGTNDFLAFIPSANGDNTSMRLRYREASGTGFNVDATTIIPTNAWAHVALTLDWDDLANVAAVKIYLNGILVGSNNQFPYNLSRLGVATDNNFLGHSRWTQDINGFNGTVDDVRFYNRALTAEDVIALTGLAELTRQYDELDLGNISEITENITLPTTLGTQGVTVKWTSSKPAIIDSVGNVNRPEKYDAPVRLTADLSLEVGGKMNTLTKTFNAKVLGILGTPQLIAQWTFDSESISIENDTVFVSSLAEVEMTGKLMNDASLRTIGETTQFNVLDLGNGTGYFDMGTDIGEAIYALSDYTIMGYFRVEEDYNIGASGNYFYAFSNTDNADRDRNGYLIGRLNVTGHQCTSGYWGQGRMEVATNQPAPKGAWHHYAYVQEGNIGKIYIDGVLSTEGVMTQLPSTSLALGDRNGTLYNWLGRSIGLSSDVYLRQTLIYDFNVYSIPITGDNLVFDFDVPNQLGMLNFAYVENPDFKSPTLLAEFESLELTDLSAVTSDISLPTQGAADENIAIIWSSSHPQIISNEGVVTRPDFFDFNVTLTATLSLGAQSMQKSFPATVLVQPGTAFTGDKIAHFEFSNAEGRIVRDRAEKQFTGTIVDDATVRTIGTDASGKFDVLDLGNGTGYFDMGEEIGKAFVHLNNYTVSAYYRIHEEYAELESNGNFLFTFSNTNDGMAQRLGYFIASLRNQGISITPVYYEAATGNQAASFAQPALQDNWYHFAYTQNDGIGTIYVNGMAVIFSDITNTPANTLQRNGFIGTPYNWIGKSNYISDVYLRQTLVHDVRVYQRALTDVEILLTELNVGETLENLDLAYAANSNEPSGLLPIQDSPYRLVVTDNTLSIRGLNGTENINVYDVAGRSMNTSTKNQFTLNQGIYIVKIDQFSAKVLIP